ncbi:MAG: 2-dehydropantoate 2-reductase [Deltaproteobacteria bacterium]|nr:2-dehydropantoate 2-reductase [Deltaproteobacteria bacterium]
MAPELHSSRILILGAGGIGGVIAARLAAAGLRPVVVTHNPDIASAIQRRGILVSERGRAQRRVPVRAAARLDELPAWMRFDVAMLCMKATSAVGAAREVLGRLTHRGFVLCCQNGIVEDAVAGEIGQARCVSAIVGWAATLLAPGEVDKSGPGKILIGELDRPPSDRVVRLARILSHVSPTEACPKIRGALWAKLALNCMSSTLGALSGLSVGRMLDSRAGREAFLAIYREVLDTAEAAGIELVPVSGPPRSIYLERGAAPLARARAHGLLRLLGFRYRRLKSSMLQSLERGRPTEIDYLNGYVLARADELGVPAPANRSAVDMLREIERGERRSGPETLAAVAAAAAKYGASRFPVM